MEMCVRGTRERQGRLVERGRATANKSREAGACVNGLIDVIDAKREGHNKCSTIEY